MNYEGTPLIVVVDDDQAVRESLAFLFDARGFVTNCFSTAEEVFKTGLSDEARYLFVDVRLPGMSGVEFVRQLEERGVDVPVALMTGHADHDVLSQLMLTKGLSLLTKPCDPNQMLSMVSDAVSEAE